MNNFFIVFKSADIAILRGGSALCAGTVKLLDSYMFVKQTLKIGGDTGRAI